MKKDLGGHLDGMLAEYVVLPEEGLVLLPAHLSYEEGATLPCAAVTAWNALMTQTRLLAGETVLMLGTGAYPYLRYNLPNYTVHVLLQPLAMTTN